MSDATMRLASASDRELTAIQAGREVTRRFSLADLTLIADTLGIDAHDLTITGALRARSEEAVPHA